ncbi:hypothetical protein Bca4012_058031 [Brassica carinata]
MITRSNLAEQLREYQIRSKHDWASVSFFSSTSNFSSSRVDVVVFVIWELVILAFLVFSAVSLYFKRLELAFILVCVTLLLLLCMKITKQVRVARKKKRRMLLPLSILVAGTHRFCPLKNRSPDIRIPWVQIPGLSLDQTELLTLSAFL